LLTLIWEPSFSCTRAEDPPLRLAITSLTVNWSSSVTPMSWEPSPSWLPVVVQPSCSGAPVRCCAWAVSDALVR